MECASALLIAAGGDVISAIASGMNVRQKKLKASAIFLFRALSCYCVRRESICRCPCPSSMLTGTSVLPSISAISRVDKLVHLADVS
jgi:hypothetical protein